MEESQAHSLFSYPAHRGWEVGSGGLEDSPACWPVAVGTVFSYFKTKRLDWMTQNRSHGSGGRRGGKRYPPQLGTLSSLPGPAGLFGPLRPSWASRASERGLCTHSSFFWDVPALALSWVAPSYPPSFKSNATSSPWGENGREASPPLPHQPRPHSLSCLLIWCLK